MVAPTNDSVAVFGEELTSVSPVGGTDGVWAGAGLAVAQASPLTNLTRSGNGLVQYTVRKGDTLAKIAAQFGVDTQTVRAANGGLKAGIHVGEQLTILPVSGFLLSINAGDSVDSVAAHYGVDPDLVRQYNPGYQEIFAAGTGAVVIPYAKPDAKLAAGANTTTGALPDLKDYFILPAQGWNWGQLHPVNAVDIANKCGTEVHAAAEGLVIPDDQLGDGTDGWNGGYGIFVLVEHPNGTKTRYAHLGKVLVKIGDYVTQGQTIGLMGDTGNADGPAGCHVHFEVLGAKNPFALH